MKPVALKLKYVALAIAGILAAAPVLAEKPSWAGADKGGKHEGGNRPDKQGAERRDGDGSTRRDGGGDSAGQRRHFEDRHQTIVHEYYGNQFRGGNCPPGLAKKHNGCMPPGQARKWQMGQPLARDIVYYPVPQALVIQIGMPPPGYRYVRVAGDILLIAIGTGMIVDAIHDLGGR